ncbi:hypothetical protein [Paenibacillus spongiae]|uniref:DUF975 family protein n=1 Tax=Paenibacillus spongiae TaxID=2909671 RepID=A0ABY5S540_9BACL|nr:hypothetical protein [Paenibacillus spongiae]UVI28804.1 hypothetical protein L1F29_25690 [Paenibacillus spongiae]
MLKQLLGLLFRNPLLLIYPIVLDGLSFITGLMIVGFIGTPSLSYRLILEMGLPSVSYVSNIPQFVNQLQFMGGTVPASAWIAVLSMLLATVFTQGGYIASLRNAVEGQPISLRQFMRDGKSHWVRFIFMFLIFTAAKTALTTLLVALFNAIGLFLSLVIFVILRIRYIYVEYCIVIDRLNVDAAFRQSRRYVQASSFKTLGLVAVLFIASGTISLLLHWVWNPVAVMAAIPLCAVVIGAIQLAFMQQLCQTKQTF